MNTKPIVCVDLDGVLNLFDEWRGNDYFHPPRPGAAEFLSALNDAGFEVVIHTVRWAPNVWHWLHKWGLATYVTSVTDRKLPAHVYIDDRAICFAGDFEDALQKARTFRAYHETPST
jgi:hypothetical protein